MVNLYIYGLLGCLLAQGMAEKVIYFSHLKCTKTSRLIRNVSYFLDDNSTLSFQGTVGNTDLNNVVGIMQYDFVKNSVNTLTVLKGLRLEICKMLSDNIRPSVLSFLYRGLLNADNNFPNRCPFKKNSFYEMRHIRFDANKMPITLPENNFTITIKFYANNSPIFNVIIAGKLFVAGKQSHRKL